MIDQTYRLSITRQALILCISRGSVYYRAEPVCEADLGLMRRIDQLHLDYPFVGNRMLQSFLVRSRRLWYVMESPRCSIPINAANLPALPLQTCSTNMTSRSAWMEKGLGATMFLSSGFGGPSNMRRSICGHTTLYRRPASHSDALSTASIMLNDPFAALTDKLLMRPTSTRSQQFSRQHKKGRNPVIKIHRSLQTNRATSL